MGSGKDLNSPIPLDRWTTLSTLQRVASSRLRNQSSHHGVLLVSYSRQSCYVQRTKPSFYLVIGDLSTLFKSHFDQDNSPASNITDQSWIKPGNVAWHW